MNLDSQSIQFEQGPQPREQVPGRTVPLKSPIRKKNYTKIRIVSSTKGFTELISLFITRLILPHPVKIIKLDETVNTIFSRKAAKRAKKKHLILIG